MSSVAGNTDASRRKKLAREAVQVKVKGMRLLGKLADIAKEAKTAAPADIARLKLQADIYFGLLKKVLPDQKALEITGDVTYRDESQMTRAELEAIAAEGRERVTTPAGRDGEPSAVH
jgi:hypothetical protein